MPVRLLLIEDNPGDAVIFREKLGASPLDASVVHAVRLRDALEQLEAGAFDLVLVDLSLPDTEGLETVDRVREAAPHLPLIVLTGLDDAATAAEAKKRGAVDYLVKWYVDSASLARYIRYAIEQYRLMGSPRPAEASPAVPADPAGQDAREPSPARVVAEPAGDGAPMAHEEVAPAAETAPVEAPPVLDEAPLDEEPLVPALEAALAVATQTAALAEHLAGSLRAALALARGDGGDAAPHPAPLDVLALAQHAADRAHTHALRAGIPLRVHAERSRVVATTDRRALGEALGRLVALVLATGGASGAHFTVSPERARTTITVAWELRRGARLPEPDDPLLALDLVLCRRLTARAGGTFSLRVDGSEAVVVLVLDAPSHG